MRNQQTSLHHLRNIGADQVAAIVQTEALQPMHAKKAPPALCGSITLRSSQHKHG
jgi:hypothetical protein